MGGSEQEVKTGKIDWNACLLKGLIGGIGAIPGTCGSHPCDVLKIRMQIKGDSLSSAFKTIYNASSIKGGVPGVGNFYRGITPAFEQRLITRFPMFLFSELYSQAVLQNTDLGRTAATFVGSVGSGFTTGSLAAVAEYRKKLLSQQVIAPEEAGYSNLFKIAKKHGTTKYLWWRIGSAGICSATYDSFFFGTEHYLSHSQGYTPALSYGFAAVNAVVLAFAFDTVVSRMMVVPPSQPCLSFIQQFKAVFPRSAYKGMSARAMEYFINYGITGATSVYVVMMFNNMGVGETREDVAKKGVEVVDPVAIAVPADVGAAPVKAA